jgi:hypothetical protein
MYRRLAQRSKRRKLAWGRCRFFFTIIHFLPNRFIGVYRHNTGGKEMALVLRRTKFAKKTKKIK